MNKEKNHLNLNLDFLDKDLANVPDNLKDNKEHNKVAVLSDVSQPPPARPWVRFFARNIDNYLFAFFLGLLWGFFLPSYVPKSDIGFGIIAIFLWMFVEPVFLSSWGTTFGKWLLGVKVRNNEDKNLIFSLALKRSFLVCFKGLGIGIPIVSLFTLVSAYSDLKKKGITTWDKDCHLTVIHQKPGVVRTAIAILITGLFIVIFIGLKD